MTSVITSRANRAVKETQRGTSNSEGLFDFESQRLKQLLVALGGVAFPHVPSIFRAIDSAQPMRRMVRIGAAEVEHAPVGQ